MEALAAKSGCSRQAIWNIEVAGQQPRIELALAIAKALDVPVSRLFRRVSAQRQDVAK